MSTVSETSKTATTEVTAGASAHSNELGMIQLAHHLNGSNYMIWSQVVHTKLKGKGKIHHLINLPPSTDDPRFEAWDVEDALIMSWLWDSMHPAISGNCMFLTTAKEIWDTVKKHILR